MWRNKVEPSSPFEKLSKQEIIDTLVGLPWEDSLNGMPLVSAKKLSDEQRAFLARYENQGLTHFHPESKTTHGPTFYCHAPEAVERIAQKEGFVKYDAPALRDFIIQEVPAIAAIMRESMRDPGNARRYENGKLVEVHVPYDEGCLIADKSNLVQSGHEELSVKHDVGSPPTTIRFNLQETYLGRVIAGEIFLQNLERAKKKAR